MSAVRIALGRNGRSGRIALIDPDDADLVQARSWHFSRGYAVTHTPRTPFRQMHRLIMSPPIGLLVDHINGDGLDNRRANLRLCTHAQNRANSRAALDRRDALRGVSPAGRGRFRAVIGGGGKVRQLGMFDTAEEAGRAYDHAAREAFGEFARLNFPGPGEQGCLDGGLPYFMTTNLAADLIEMAL